MQTLTKAGFAGSYVVPALLLFAIPTVGLVFAAHATHGFDDRFITAVKASLDDDGDVTPAYRHETLTFFRENPPSLLCRGGTEERALLPASYADEACRDYAQLRQIVQASFASIVLGLLSVVVAIVCAALSFLSRPAQYLSFATGWQLLRVASAIQVLTQGFIAVMLSFWVTAYFFERYYVKAVVCAGVLALAAAVVVIIAIFKRPRDRLDVEGEFLPRETSPELWAGIDALCSRLGTPPPSQMIGGIDDNFFVTEHPVHVAGRMREGRSLFVSLSLLKRLDKSEADAILAHEMAHFSGGDTLYAKKLAPLLAHFRQYLVALHQGGLSLPIFYFMLFYWSMFQLSLGRSSRQRELRADTIASETTSAQSVASALLKVAAYSAYRARVEAGLFERNRAHSDLNIAQSVAVGFTEYARGPRLAADLGADDAFPHPFDSHPSLPVRLANVGVQLAPEHLPEIVASTAARTWFSEIGEAERIEADLWRAYEQRFQAVHEESLAYRFLPATAEERAHVERFFPPLSLAGRKAGNTLELDCLQLRYEEWPDAIAWASIKTMKADDASFRGKILTIRFTIDGREQKRELPLRKLADKDDAVVSLVSRYYGRALAAKEHSAQGGAA